MKGWVFDYYPDSRAMVVWLWREKGVVKLRIPFRPYLYVDSSCSRKLFSLLPKLEVPLKVKRGERETLQGERAAFFMVQAFTPGCFQLLSRVLQRKMPPEALYNVDIPLEQLFSYETGLFPLAQVELEVRKGWIQEYGVLDSPLDTRYPLPPLRIMELYPDVPYNPNHGTKAIPLVVECEGERYLLDEDIPEALASFLKRWDPDVIVTRLGTPSYFPGWFSWFSSTGTRTRNLHHPLLGAGPTSPTARPSTRQLTRSSGVGGT
ncbi:MAG TPA: hypothetical protein ENF32_06240 [Thermosulfidibacter takaii]|uniref:Uncharacterized protein n=1 Tax=Thermosulfidibacter takaii TaxID=412593 RepID=A0A7C0Y8T3_9BACT|nr:hypothetical protein [Thermosulfidibacter takaii]